MRELTKRFESIHLCLIGEAVEWLKSDADRQRGEFVVIVTGYKGQTTGIDLKAQETLQILLKELPLSQAAGIAAQITGYKKNELYELALRFKGTSNSYPH